jgi:hypothetical protein
MNIEEQLFRSAGFSDNCYGAFVNFKCRGFKFSKQTIGRPMHIVFSYFPEVDRTFTELLFDSLDFEHAQKQIKG